MDDDDDRSDQVRSALVKGIAVLAAILVAIAVGTTLMVKALDLESDDSGPVGSSAESVSPSALPESALPEPGEDDTASSEPSGLVSPSGSGTEGVQAGDGEIELSISPVNPRPGERINLTGSYGGADNVVLQVQRFENGAWGDFDARTTVRVGTFATYIITSRTGESRFRVYDPQSKTGSNVILVTIR